MRHDNLVPGESREEVAAGLASRPAQEEQAVVILGSYFDLLGSHQLRFLCPASGPRPGRMRRFIIIIDSELMEAGSSLRALGPCWLGPLVPPRCPWCHGEAPGLGHSGERGRAASGGSWERNLQLCSAPRGRVTQGDSDS